MQPTVPTTPRNSWSSVLAIAALAFVALPQAARAGTVETDRSCYLNSGSTTVAMRGTGFTPGDPFAVMLDGAALAGGSGAIAADGSMSGTFPAPALPGDIVQRRFRLGLQTTDGTPTSSFTVTRLSASFWPTAGRADRLRVRFSLFGFGLAGPAKQIYVHYVAPNRRLQKTVALGRPRGQCGAIPRTARRALFPMPVTCAGLWHLQFDTRRSFRRGTSTSSFLHYTIDVRVSPQRPGAGRPSRCPAGRG